MKVVGITGPTGAGKTTVLNALQELGGAIIDCDAVYHRLLSESKSMLEELRKQFGDSVFDEAGALKRKALGTIVFQNQDALQILNTITHRYISEEVDRLLEAAREEGRIAAAVDAIALLESGLKDRCSVLLAVTAPPEIRAERIMMREGISREYAETRIAAQKPSSYFEEYCDYVFINDFPDAETAKEQARELFQTILKEELSHE